MEAGIRPHPQNYSRKEKSLGLLCANFITLYNRDGVDSVGLDDAAARLGVERRRIYDIVNVLESIGVLSRKAKNRYRWIGFSGIPKALADLKSEALREIAGGGSPGILPASDDEEEFKPPPQASADDLPQGKSRSAENRREKSLGLLTQSFVKVFLTSEVETISLDEAARLLLGDGDSSTMRNNAAKVRRLYDIANVLSSMKLIEKTQNSESRKPAFRWIGAIGKPIQEEAVLGKQKNKRAFGTDVTNTEIKKGKLASPPAEGKQRKTVALRSKTEDLKECNLAASRQLLRGNKGYAFGPFCPANAEEKKPGEEDEGKATLDWEAMAASLHPRYHNQALGELFAHYLEAWKSWYAQLAQDGQMEHLCRAADQPICVGENQGV
ncbi:E2F transcription factor-like E2FE isoform X2 [Wolffia australiana]